MVDVGVCGRCCVRGLFVLSVLKSECGMLVFLKLARLSRWLLGFEACCVIVLWLLVCDNVNNCKCRVGLLNTD